MLSTNSKAFRTTVWRHYRMHGRDALPWRKTKDPYKILVSEIMLQQTQVERVIPFYKKFLKEFPSVSKLAQAPLADVLRAWQGLGYNRRAKMLHAAAKEIVEKRNGTFPKTVRELESLPGVGPYTARAVGAFASNSDVILIETNVRTAVTHHFFPKKKKVSDAEILTILEEVFPKGKSREWYGALMDYGSHLKQSGIRINAQSKHYTKQSTFSGSAREARGAILRALAKTSYTKPALLKMFETDRSTQVAVQLEKLQKEGFIVKGPKGFSLAQ